MNRALTYLIVLLLIASVGFAAYRRGQHDGAVIMRDRVISACTEDGVNVCAIRDHGQILSFDVSQTIEDAFH